MTNINDIEKDKHTNTFWVNPTLYNEHGEVVKEPDELGVSFPVPSYKDGIEVPDKFVTIGGATNYHILDAVNLYWNNASIPWATKITKWGGSGKTIDERGNEVLINRSDMYAPEYQYNKPKETGWTDGTIKETEDIADILNYLIYRVVSLDFFMDHWNDLELQSPALRLVNHRTDWYSDDLNPDIIDGDSGTMDEDKTSDNRFTVRSSGVVVNLYPYLVSRYWVGYDDENNELNTAYKTKLLDSDQNNRPGVVVSDTGWPQQRAYIYAGNDRKIVKGNENFDIFEVETRSNSNQIEFISRNKNVIDGYVQKSIEVFEDEDDTKTGGVKTITTVVSDTSDGSVLQTNYLYKLPVVAYKCLDADVYPYNTSDVIKTLLRYNYIGVQNSVLRPAVYKEIRNTSITPQFDPSFMNTTFGVTIAKSQNAVNGYASGTCLCGITVYKGDNTLIDLSLVDKSVINTDENGDPFTVQFNNSHNEIVNVHTYTTKIAAPENEADYDNEETANIYKAKINFEAEFGPTYDAQHNGSDEEMLKKSFVYPYFIVKLDIDNTPNYMEIYNSINEDAYRYIYSNEFDSEHSENFTLFYNTNYGKVTYEKYQNKWCYFYYPPSKDNIVFDEHGEYKIKLFALMYYPIDDVTTNRLLNPLWAELAITVSQDLKPVSIIDFNSITYEEDIDENQYIKINDISIEDDYILADVTSIDDDGFMKS